MNKNIFASTVFGILLSSLPVSAYPEWVSLGALSNIKIEAISPDCSYRFALDQDGSNGIEQRLSVSYVRVQAGHAALEADVGGVSDAFDGLRPAMSACLKTSDKKNLDTLVDFKIKAVWLPEGPVLNVQCAFQRESGAYANKVSMKKLSGFKVEKNCS